MLFEYETLQIIWWILIGVLLIGFALTGGMDMAVSVLLFRVGKTPGERGAILSTIVPHWDGNQVWLITAGGAIFAAWPEVYAASFSGMYWAMILLLAFIWLRPLAFDYRNHCETPVWRTRWDIILTAGSLIPLMIFGIAFGNLLQGLPFWADEQVRWHYEGTFLFALLPLLNPFALLCGVVCVMMLLTHACMWIQLRCSGDVAHRAHCNCYYFAIATMLLFIAAGICSFSFDGPVLQSPAPEGSYQIITAKTVEFVPHGLFMNYLEYPITLVFPIVALLGMFMAMVCILKDRPGQGILWTSAGVAATIATPAVSLFPFIMPSSIDPASSLTIYDATSSAFTLNAMLIAALILVPVAVAYTVWAYKKMWHRAPESSDNSTYNL